MLIPTVIEKNNDEHQAYDLYSRLLKDRIIVLSGESFKGMRCRK